MRITAEVVLMPAGCVAEKRERVIERGPQDGIAVAATARRAGQVDDQSAARRAPATPRESRPCGVFAIESARSASAIPGASRSRTRARRLRRHVPRRETGAAGRQDERCDARPAPRSPLRSRRPRRGRRGARRRSRPRAAAPRARRRCRPPPRRARRGRTRSARRRSFLRLLDELDREGDLLVDRLHHVVERQRCDRRGRQCLHLDAGLRGRLRRGDDLDTVVRRRRARPRRA